MPTLRDLSAALESAVNDALGDEITYTPSGGEADTFNAWVEFGTVDITAGSSRATAERIVIEVPFAKVAAPSSDDRITIALRPGLTFKPASVDRAPTGDGSIIVLAKVAS